MNNLSWPEGGKCGLSSVGKARSAANRSPHHGKKNREGKERVFNLRKGKRYGVTEFPLTTEGHAEKSQKTIFPGGITSELKALKTKRACQPEKKNRCLGGGGLESNKPAAPLPGEKREQGLA